MKPFLKSLLAVCNLLLPLLPSAQVTLSSCDNHNAFVQSHLRSTLESITDTIYPNGRMLFIPDSVENQNPNTLFSLLGLDNGTSFDSVDQAISLVDSGVLKIRYQQYFDGIEVQGGGGTVSYAIPSGGGPIGIDDCYSIIALSPFVLTELDSFDTKPTLNDSSDILTALSVSKVSSAQLKIMTYTDSCQYRLVYDVTYVDTFPKRSWVDAETGVILLTEETNVPFNGPTEDFGNRPMNDSDLDAATKILISEDGRIRTYDMNQTVSTREITVDDYDVSLIPTTPSANGQWSTQNAPTSVFQTHWMAAQTLENLSKFFTFDEVNLAANCRLENARSVSEPSGFSVGYFAFGEHPTGGTMAHFDVMGHEFAHRYLQRWLDITPLTSGALHEAIADMIGVYNEEQFEGSPPDWEMGDNIPSVVRDLENTVWDCFTNASISATNVKHIKGGPLGHWYYLISEGDVSEDIPALGTERALEIVLTGVMDIGMTGYYDDLMQSTIQVALETYGRCSNEFISVARAWEKICVETGLIHISTIPECNYNFEVPAIVCEEDDYLQICLTDAVPTYAYRWTIIAKQSPEYKLNGHQTGNSTVGTGLTCLRILDFPKYSSYPQVVTIEVYSPNLGSSYLVRKRFTLRDCNGDDPPCGSANSNIVISNRRSKSTTWLKNGVRSSVQEFSKGSIGAYDNDNDGEVRVYDILGREILSTRKDQLRRDMINSSLPSGTIVVITWLDSNGIIRKFAKEYFVRR